MPLPLPQKSWLILLSSVLITTASYAETTPPISHNSAVHAPATVKGLAMPESAVAHPDGRVFVTEIGEFGKMGDGKVTIVHLDGSIETLAAGLNDPKGIDLYNNELYVADINQLVKVSLDGNVDILLEAGDFPGKAEFLNDIEIDGHGNVYLSDSGTDSGEFAGIYKVTPQGGVTEIINDKAGIKRPNGLLMDGYNKLLVADFGTGDLFQLTISSAQAKKINSGFGGADGLVRDTDGFLYITDWENGKLWQLIEPKATPQLIDDEFEAAADIGLSADGRNILLPDMTAGKLYFVPIK